MQSGLLTSKRGGGVRWGRVWGQGRGGCQSDPLYLVVVSARYTSVSAQALLLQQDCDCHSKAGIAGGGGEGWVWGGRLGVRSMGLTCG